MSLTAFTRIGEYTLPTITGSHTDFVVLLRYDDFIAGVLSKLDDGGGDLRFSSDAAGATQLPCEVVTFDKVGGTAEVWVKVPSAATGTVIHIWGDNSGASQPAVTDPFGRNAVWSDYHRVFHLSESANTVSGGYADSTGDGSATGVSMTLPNVPNVWGRDTAQLDGSGDFLQSAISLSDDAAGVTLSGWAKVDSLATDSRLLSLSDLTTTSGTSSTRGPVIWMDEGGSGDGWAIIDKAGGISPNTSDNNATTDWQYIVAYFSSSAMRLYVDGTQTQSFGSTGIDLSVNPYLKIGRIWNESSYFDGGISNVKVVAGDYSGRVSTEYSNQSAVGAWGTMTDVGGTGGVTSNVAATWPLFSVSADQQSAAPSYDSTVAATWPMFSASADITAVVPNYTTDISATWPLFAINADQAGAEPTYSSDVSATWPLFSVSSDQESTLPSGATTVQAQWPMFGVSAAQDSTVPAYSADVSATWPMFAIDATQDQTLPSGGATVAVEWPMFGVAASQDSTVPSYDTAVSATWPMFSVSAISGEFDYRTDPQAKLALPFKSRRLTLPYQSRKIVL